MQSEAIDRIDPNFLLKHIFPTYFWCFILILLLPHCMLCDFIDDSSSSSSWLLSFWQYCSQSSEPFSFMYIYILGNMIIFHDFQFSSVQLLSHAWLFAITWTAACQASLSITNSQSLLKPMSIKSVMPSNHLNFYYPLLLLPSIFPSIRDFANKSVLPIMWPKYWSFSISPSNEYSGLISFRIDWFNLLAVQGTLKSLLLYHNSKTSILWCSTFLIVQLSHPSGGQSIGASASSSVFPMNIQDWFPLGFPL